jgi:hypothetical protein
VRPEGLSQLKIPMTLSGIDPATFRYVEQYLSQLRHGVSHIYGTCLNFCFLDSWLKHGTICFKMGDPANPVSQVLLTFFYLSGCAVQVAEIK